MRCDIKTPIFVYLYAIAYKPNKTDIFFLSQTTKQTNHLVYLCIYITKTNMAIYLIETNKNNCVFYLYQTKQNPIGLFIWNKKQKRLYFVFIVDICYGTDKWCL